MRKEIRIAVWRMVAGIICFVLMGVMIGAMVASMIPIPKVEASGSTQVTMRPGSDSADKYLGSDYYSSWNSVCTASTATTSSDAFNMWGIYRTSIGNYKAIAAYIDISVSAIPDGADIEAMYIELYFNGETDSNWQEYETFWSVYAGPSPDGSPANSDFNDFRTDWEMKRLTYVQRWTERPTVNSWISLAIKPDMWEWVNDQSMIRLVICTENHALNYAPYATTGTSRQREMKFATYQQGTSYMPKIDVFYVTPPDPRVPDLHTNAAVDTSILGNEVADNITLETLRYMYADETLSFLVNGDSGANITMELVSSGGTVLETSADSIRTDGVYSWQIDLPTNYSGIVRMHEKEFNLYSEWVAVRPAPDDSQGVNKVYAEYTEYPQYDKDFTSYVIQSGDIMEVHWCTNIEPDTELPDFCLRVQANSDNETTLFIETLEDLAADYMLGTEANQQALAHWRYMLFTTGKPSGFNDYGGLIQNLDIGYDTTKRGFLEYIIVESSDNTSELAPMHSAYWNIQDSDDGIKVSMVDNNITTDETPEVKITIGPQTKVEYNLSVVTAEIVGESGYGEGILTVGTNYIEIPPVATEGEYTVRVTLSDDDITSYEYIKDLELTVSETGISEADASGPGGFLEGIFDWFTGKGIDFEDQNTRYIILLVCSMLAALFMLGIGPKVAAGAFLLVWGFGIIAGWVDPWLLIALGLGAGVWIWFMFRKSKTPGSEG